MQNWHINEIGQIEAGQHDDDLELPDGDYRLYRFLTELEDLMAAAPDETTLLKKLCPMVRRLLTRSFWLQGSYREPNAKTGWSVEKLYDEPDFPLTVQMVAWNPGSTSPIHNHGTWGLVALVEGSEKNFFWQEKAVGELESAGEKVFEAGDIVTFLPETIHHIEALGDEPVISFNIYGKTDYKNRFRFDRQTGTKKTF